MRTALLRARTVLVLYSAYSTYSTYSTVLQLVLYVLYFLYVLYGTKVRTLRAYGITVRAYLASLPTACYVPCCPLPTAHCPLPAAHCLLPYSAAYHVQGARLLPPGALAQTLQTTYRSGCLLYSQVAACSRACGSLQPATCNLHHAAVRAAAYSLQHVACNLHPAAVRAAAYSLQPTACSPQPAACI